MAGIGVELNTVSKALDHTDLSRHTRGNGKTQILEHFQKRSAQSRNHSHYANKMELGLFRKEFREAS